MSKVLVIGCGGVASVAISKCCQVSDVFTELCIASRTKSKCDALAAKLAPTTRTKITTAQVDADDVQHLCDLINSYFEAPRHHTLLVQLLDCRHAPSADDEQMLRYLHYHQIPYVVALTKADKLKKSQLAKTLEDFENLCRPYGCQKVVLTSGENGYGIPELQAVLNAAVAGEQEAE